VQKKKKKKKTVEEPLRPRGPSRQKSFTAQEIETGLHKRGGGKRKKRGVLRFPPTQNPTDQ